MTNAGKRVGYIKDAKTILKMRAYNIILLNIFLLLQGLDYATSVAGWKMGIQETNTLIVMAATHFGMPLSLALFKIGAGLCVWAFWELCTSKIVRAGTLTALCLFYANTFNQNLNILTAY